MPTGPKKNIPILMYHSVSEHVDQKFRAFAVSPSLFAEHMAYLHQHWYTPITVTHYVQSRSGGFLPDRPVVITFDDGFADFFTDALPILQRYAFVATLYVTTAFVNGTSRWLRHEGEATHPMITWEQLREACTYGIECGAHSHSHPQLDTLPASLAREEILLSKRILESQLSRDVLSFAYPFGYQTATTRQLVRQSGYTSACAVMHKTSSSGSNPFALERLMVDSSLHRDAFAALLSGRSSPTKALHTLYLRMRTPLWQLVRRSSISLTSSLGGRAVIGWQ